MFSQDEYLKHCLHDTSQATDAKAFGHLALQNKAMGDAVAQPGKKIKFEAGHYYLYDGYFLWSIQTERGEWTAHAQGSERSAEPQATLKQMVESLLLVPVEDRRPATKTIAFGLPKRVRVYPPLMWGNSIPEGSEGEIVETYRNQFGQTMHIVTPDAKPRTRIHLKDSEVMPIEDSVERDPEPEGDDALQPASYDDLVDALREQISPDGTPDLYLALNALLDLTGGILDVGLLLAWLKDALKPFADAARLYEEYNGDFKYERALWVYNALNGDDLNTLMGTARDDTHIPY